MKNDALIIAGALALAAVPFGLAIHDDASDESDPYAALRDSVAEGLYDEPTQEPDYDDYDEADEPDFGRYEDPVPRAMADQFFREAILGSPPSSKPTLTGKFSELRFGMPEVQALDMALPIYRMAREGESPWEHTELYIEFADRVGLRRVSLDFPDDGTAQATLKAAWKAPIKTVLHGYFWFNEENHTRAWLTNDSVDEAALHLDGYLPIAEFIGDKKGTFGFETIDIMSSRPAALRKAFGEQYEQDGPFASLVMLPTTYDLNLTNILVTYDEGKCIGVSFSIGTQASEDAYATIRGLLDKKFGEPKSDYDSDILTYLTKERSIEVTYNDDYDRFSFEIRRR
jgi:hypothetical protein